MAEAATSVEPGASVDAPSEARDAATGGGEAGRSWVWWFRRGVWAVGDQGTFAAANFITSVVLARRLSAPAYGAFVLAYSVLQVVGQLHVGLLIDPMQVFGAGRHADRFASYVRTLTRIHFKWTTIGAGVFALLALALERAGKPVLASAFAGVAVGGPFLSLSWLLRGACTARLRPEWAALAGVANLVLVLGGLQVLDVAGRLSPWSAFAVIGGASLVAAAALMWRLGVLDAPAFGRADHAAVVGEHRQYGRWTASAGVLNWVPAEIFYLVLPVWGGLGQTATAKALVNLILPALQTHFVLSNLLTPTLARARGRAEFGRILRGAFLVVGIAYGAYWLVLGLAHDPLLRLLYAGRFMERSELLWAFGAVPLAYFRWGRRQGT